MGSGIEIKEALKKYGRKFFKKEILFEYDTKEEMLAKEKELVTREFCMREDTYNRIEGGGVYCTQGMITVKNKKGNTSKVYCDDPRYLSGELVHVTKGTVTVKDNEGNCFRVEINDPRYLSGELISHTKGVSCNIGLNVGRVHTEETRKKMSEGKNKDKDKSLIYFRITNGERNARVWGNRLQHWIDNGWYKGTTKINHKHRTVAGV